jgi:RNA polymerase sigma factor (sigma-70 family)
MMLILEAIRLRPMLVNRAKQIVGDAAEDVVQDLFEYLIRSRMNSGHTPEVLLMWYIKNRCIQHLRKVNPVDYLKADIKPDAYTGGVKHEPINYTYNPDWPEIDDEIENERITLILDAISQIHPFAREFFILVHIDGKSQIEISRETGIPIERLWRLNKYILKSIIYEHEKTKESKRTTGATGANQDNNS